MDDTARVLAGSDNGSIFASLTKLFEDFESKPAKVVQEAIKLMNGGEDVPLDVSLGELFPDHGMGVPVLSSYLSKRSKIHFPVDDLESATTLELVKIFNV